MRNDKILSRQRRKPPALQTKRASAPMFQPRPIGTFDTHRGAYRKPTTMPPDSHLLAIALVDQAATDESRGSSAIGRNIRRALRRMADAILAGQG
jgi:hypothetical protein